MSAFNRSKTTNGRVVPSPDHKACNLVCDVVGIEARLCRKCNESGHEKAFVKALDHVDLDPIYFCEAML